MIPLRLLLIKQQSGACIQMARERLAARIPSPADSAGGISLSCPTALYSALQHGGRCEVCGESARVVFATPCGHLTCVDCTAQDATACRCCGQPYVMQARRGMGLHVPELGFWLSLYCWRLTGGWAWEQGRGALPTACGAAEAKWGGPAGDAQLSSDRRSRAYLRLNGL